MAKKCYVGKLGVARNCISIYVGDSQGRARKVIKGYVGDSQGKARLFWDGSGIVIFYEGEFDHVPQGLDIFTNIEEVNTDISDLVTYFGTNKTLWVHDAAVVDRWNVSGKLLVSGYYDADVQIIKNALYIPINQRTGTEKLKVTAKGNLMFQACYVSNGAMVESAKAYICNANFTTQELDVSSLTQIDYVKISAPDTYFAHKDDVTNPYVYQPIPFVETGHIYTNNKGQTGLPGYEWNQTSGGTIRAFLKYREPDNSNQCIYMLSTEPFTVEMTNRALSSPLYETWQSEQIQNNPPIYKIVREGYWWGYKPQNLPYWHTNYYGGWNTNYDIDVGNIVLYGSVNTLQGFGQMSSYFDAGEPVQDWQLSANGWVQHFENPIVIYEDSSYLKLWDYTYETMVWNPSTGKYEWVTKHGKNGIGMKDITGTAPVYLFFASLGDTLWLYAVSTKPFSAYLLAKEWESSTEDTDWYEHSENAGYIQYYGLTYYVLHDFTYTNLADSPVTNPDGTIDITAIDSFFRHYNQDFNGKGEWTAAHIVLGGVISGGCLQQIQKIEVVGGSEVSS